jgi:drug/metabolite transporter (DMT)-like permease
MLLTIFTPKVVLILAETPAIWPYGILLGTFGAVIPVLLFGLGAPKINPGLASILSAGEFPVAVFASVLVLHEQVTSLQWLGIVVILLGIAYPQLKASSTSAKERISKAA